MVLPFSRRWIVAALPPLLLCAGAMVSVPERRAAAGGPPSLYVCLPTDVKSTVLERALQSKLPALAVTVFGRFRDFDEALTAKRPDAVLALHPLLDVKEMKSTLRGVEDGKDADSVVLVSAGAPLQGTLANRTVGVVDLLGRKETQDMVARLTGTPAVKTKLVTKPEDLLSLLQFSAADAVLVSSGLLKMLEERTRMPLHVRELPSAQVGRASIAVLSPAARDLVIKQVQGLDPATNRMMGIDGWRLSR